MRGEFIWKEGGSHGLLKYLPFECNEEIFQDVERQVQLWNSQAYDKAVHEAEFQERLQLARQQKPTMNIDESTRAALDELRVQNGNGNDSYGNSGHATNHESYPPLPRSPEFSGAGPKSKLHNTTLTVRLC